MEPSDGSSREREADIDDADLSPEVRRFLEAIVQRDSDGTSPAERRRAAESERRVTRFAWTCEELNVAFADIRVDAQTIRLLADHGVEQTLRDIQAKVAALLRSIESGQPASK